MRQGRVAVFDSGLGGLSVLRQLLEKLPGESYIYYADAGRMPYGSRPLEEVQEFSIAIAGQLIQDGAKAVVVACNTASAAALYRLRECYPNTPIIGMEPAVKPAASSSKNGKVGVLATEATLHGELFASVVDRFARGVEVHCQACHGLAETIEACRGGDTVTSLVRKYVDPLRHKGVDSLVLGCTHYSLIRDVIQKAAGDGIAIFDPSAAVAKRTKSVLEENKLLNAEQSADESTPRVLFRTSGSADQFSRSASELLGFTVNVERDEKILKNF